jgi:hypothetical protein
MRNNIYIRNINHFTPFILFLFVAMVYITNLSPSAYGVDSGELIAAALTKGVPHASGYPLYTLVGIVLVRLPLGQSPAWQFGLASAFFSALGVVVFYLTCNEFVKNQFLSAIVSLSLSFTYTYWLYAEVVEVFGLHELMVISLIYFAIKFYKTKIFKFLYLMSFIAGLSLTNNQTVLTIFPAITFLVIATDYRKLFNLRIIITCSVLFLAGLLPYIYLPIAAANHPYINFGKVVNFTNFLHHATRQTYGWKLAKSISLDPTVSAKPFYHYWLTFISSLNFPLVLLGIGYLVKRKKIMLLSFLGIAFLISGPVLLMLALNEPVQSLMKLAVLERFYLQSIVISLFFSYFGLIATKDLIKYSLKNEQLKKLCLTCFYVVIVILPITTFIINYPKTNLKNVYILDDLAKDALKSLPKDSILLVQDDNLVFSSLYLQTAYDYRRDIYIPGRQDGMYQLLTYSGMSTSVADDYSTKYANTIHDQTIIYKAILSMVAKSDNEVFSDFTFTGVNLYDEEKGSVLFVPYGLTYKLYFEKDFDLSLSKYLETVNNFTKNYQFDGELKNEYLVQNNLIYSAVQKEYALSYYRIGKFILEHYGDTEKAILYINQAGKLDPVVGSETLNN